MTHEINIEATRAFIKHNETTKRIVISQGGGRSGKTFSILTLLIIEGLQRKNLLISVIAENIPFLKRGAIRDFKTILQGMGIWSDDSFKGGNQYTLPTGSVIEFFSADNPGKALGAARDILFINEANNISFEIAFQLMARTKDRVWIDFNPRSEFWAHTEIMQNKAFDGMFDFVHTTFADNALLEPTIKELMLARGAKDANYKRVYIDGQVGSVEGLVYPDFELVDTMPDMDCIGLDFGYTNSSTAAVAIAFRNDDLYISELVYSQGLRNVDIIAQLKEAGVKSGTEIWCDSAEPKSIDDLYFAGLNAKPVVKTSVVEGVDMVKRFNLKVTKDSVNVIRELRNYQYKQDKDGKWINEPVKDFDHAMDAVRYAVSMTVNKRKDFTFAININRSNKI